MAPEAPHGMLSAHSKEWRLAASPCSCWREGGGDERSLVNGVRFDVRSPDAFVARVESFCACGQSHAVHFCAAHPTVVARHDLAYRNVLNAGLNVPDGMGVVWALRAFGIDARRLAGSDAVHLLCAWGIERGVRHYLFGAAPGTAERLAEKLMVAHPGIRIVGAESPPMRTLSRRELEEASRRIRRAGADLLWVGLGAPKQDVVADRLRALASAPVILCVGAAFDYVSGVRPRAPAWMQQSGLEWLFRLAAEPRRLWRRYLIGNALFVAGVTSDLLGAGRK